MIRRRFGIVILCACAGASGCAANPEEGYSFSDAHREDINSIAVPMFENASFDNGAEFELTEAIIKEIHRTTPWRVVSESLAQTTLRGTITSSVLRQVTRQRSTGLGQEMAVELTVSFEWKENATGEVLVARRAYRASDTFVPTPPAQERIELGRVSAVQRMARDIVGELRSSW